ncbi:hypothetical protein KC909_01640 [Candidatus Dojkabacteria bacterium]|uniref:Uncharacterized protein n=1 Tax=Candidatus Dojkabacteria bacterium TaxID=2099670 RepID=A0A955L4U1_9BACT|nr:hypothetical protein [Candidatus Dojkabacteria bacterium]
MRNLLKTLIASFVLVSLVAVIVLLMFNTRISYLLNFERFFEGNTEALVASNSDIAFESATNISDHATGIFANQDNFPITDLPITNVVLEEVQVYEQQFALADQNGYDRDMKFSNTKSEQPLVAQDYYWGKYINGSAGAKQINSIPVLKPGDRVALLGDNVFQLYASNGYVKPSGYHYASGLCWSSSALGLLQDNANKAFQEKYGVPLFVFNYGDRGPHGHYYATYGGYGYTVFRQNGVPVQDYRFTVNPALADIPELADIKVKIVMTYTDEHPTAAFGQSIGGYIQSNKEF